MRHLANMETWFVERGTGHNVSGISPAPGRVAPQGSVSARAETERSPRGARWHVIHPARPTEVPQPHAASLNRQQIDPLDMQPLRLTEQFKKLIRDAIIAVGGKELGVMDDNGLQLNPLMAGLVSKLIQ